MLSLIKYLMNGLNVLLTLQKISIFRITEVNQLISIFLISLEFFFLHIRHCACFFFQKKTLWFWNSLLNWIMNKVLTFQWPEKFFCTLIMIESRNNFKRFCRIQIFLARSLFYIVSDIAQSCLLLFLNIFRWNASLNKIMN